MFLGKSVRSLDAKGRLALPARFREQLPTGSVITIAPDGCLRVYPPHEFEALTTNLRLNELNNPTERALTRRLFAEAQEVEFDAQGRALIAADLRQQAGIAGKAVVSGANNVVEIWSEERWGTVEAASSDFTHLADEVARTRNADR